jgi:pimeloyl-ACP methyl ester carboxylesterase
MALRLSYRHPRRVAAIVSLDGGPAESAATPGFRSAMRFAALLRLFGGLRRVRSAVRKTLVARSADPTWVTDEVVDGYMAASSPDLGATLAAYKGMARAREPEPLREHLHEVRRPVRLVLGAVPHEGGPSAAEIELLRSHLPIFAIDVVPGVGHFVFEENPAAVIAAVDRAGASAGSSPALASR